MDVAATTITKEANPPGLPQEPDTGSPASRNRTCVSEARRLPSLTLFFSPSPRNFSITYIIMTINSQSHLLPSQPWVCSGRFCLIRKCPPQGTFPGLSLFFSLNEENMKAQAQEMHRGRNRNHLSARMVSTGGPGNCSWWACLPWCQTLGTRCEVLVMSQRAPSSQLQPL